MKQKDLIAKEDKATVLIRITPKQHKKIFEITKRLHFRYRSQTINVLLTYYEGEDKKEPK
jgi:hypothetical protein